MRARARSVRKMSRCPGVADSKGCQGRSGHRKGTSDSLHSQLPEALREGCRGERPTSIVAHHAMPECLKCHQDAVCA